MLDRIKLSGYANERIVDARNCSLSALNAVRNQTQLGCNVPEFGDVVSRVGVELGLEVLDDAMLALMPGGESGNASQADEEMRQLDDAMKVDDPESGDEEMLRGATAGCRRRASAFPVAPTHGLEWDRPTGRGGASP